MSWANQTFPTRYAPQPYQQHAFPPRYANQGLFQGPEVPLRRPGMPEVHHIPPKPSIQHKRRCIDYPTTILIFFVWSFLVLSCIVLLGLAYVATSIDSEGGTLFSAEEVARTIALSAAPILVATILNEVLIDRCWRRVVYSALGSNARARSDKELARNLRAANFQWLDFIKRVFTWRLSKRDVRSVASYALLRWGTAVSIASVQLCVSWQPTSSVYYSSSKRYFWLVGPVVLHACSVFGTMLIWGMPPWRFFSDRFQDPGLLKRYLPYIDRVPAGSIADSRAVARFLESSRKDPSTLKKMNKPGRQVTAKIKGVWLGLVLMNVPPSLAWAFFRYAKPDDVLIVGVYRFVFNFVFLAQNILYILALDFVVWNLSLESFCRTAKGSPNENLRHLGYSSGIMLLIKAFRQRRPIRATLFLWCFWLQASLMRLLTVVYTLSVSVLSYGPYSQRTSLYDPHFWVGWVFMTSFFVFIVFVIWFFKKFQAPICEQDGWRWAKIAQNALYQPGYYGVVNGEAVWGHDVQSFEENKNQELL